MTLSKKKFRYTCIYIEKTNYDNNENDNGDSIILSDFIQDFYKRYIGLHGSVDFYKSGIRIINVVAISSEFVVIKCRLEYIDNVLLSLYFANYPLIILPVSGTIKQLRKRIQKFLIDKDFLMQS